MEKGILIYHNILWSHYTGMVFGELNTILTKNKIPLHVVHIANSQESRAGIGKINEKYHRYPYSVLFNTALEETGSIQQIIKGFKELFKRPSSIVVVFGYDLPVYMAIICLAPFCGRKLIVVADSTINDRPRSFWKERFKRLLLHRAKTILCYGQPHKRYLLGLGVPEHKIKIRVQATDNDEVRSLYLDSSIGIVLPGMPANNFIFVGRFIEEKNLFSLLSSFNACKSEWGLILVGGGILEAEIKSFCTNNNIPNVYFVGPKPLNEVVAYYKAADVLILPSISETWGLVVNEAMLCELPVIVSSHCGCSEDLVEEGKNGFTFDPKDANALTNAMLKFTTGIVNSKIMGKHSYEIAKKFTAELAAKQIFDAILPN